ncbi:hypothetical protein PBY51_006311 [Eleginops maclovinus]|uniref:Uncharacterized protein n=1 Tax=Eleginops maclovinus TaxID=56733 RepID=A0AAN7WWJ1_ELEMC|nr:hypothetical protein PBY51_006311 [Eleginops maclovinus]
MRVQFSFSKFQFKKPALRLSSQTSEQRDSQLSPLQLDDLFWIGTTESLCSAGRSGGGENGCFPGEPATAPDTMISVCQVVRFTKLITPTPQPQPASAESSRSTVSTNTA